MNHGGADGICSNCHDSNKVKFDCYKCHDKAKTVDKHNEEGISDINGRCLDCHKTEKEP